MLDVFFNPGSIAVIGASRDPDSAGQGILRSLVKGGVLINTTNKPFQGKIYPINPKATQLLGLKCYPSLLDVPGEVDLAVIVVPARIVPQIMRDCAMKKVKGVIIISAGFGELGGHGKKLEKMIMEAAKKADIRIIGPNCLGLMRPSKDLNATFGPCMAPDGNVAFFSQSGALIDSVIDWSLERNYGFSSIVSLGNSMDLDVTDFLLWAEQDKATKAIAVYIEGLKDGRKFMRIAKKVGKTKPIIVLKAGRSESGRKAVGSHTGSLAGSYDVYKAAFKQSRVHVAETVDDLFEKAEALANLPACKNNIAIITNGGGAGVLCADHCEKLGINLAQLSKATIRKLDRSGVMHPAYSRSNPLDIVGDATHERYEAAINAVLQQKDIHGVIMIQTLQTMTESLLDAEAVIKARKKYPKKPVIATYMGGKFSKYAVEMLQANKVPDFNTPAKSATAMKALIERGEWHV